MFAAANSFFGRTNISQTYTIGSSSIIGSRTSTPGPQGSGSATIPAVAHSPPFNVGPWRVQPATHKVNGKRVSVWTAEKKSAELEKMGPHSKERTLEILKAEAQALTRLRHPSVLEVVEPLEETRTELVFATEPVISSLYLSIPGSIQYTPLVELDEVEIQKGILQVCKGLTFLHDSARLIHSNITLESVLINSAGDWKISGLGLTIPLAKPDGTASRWEFPTFDGRVPAYTQRSFDYIAPEYALDEILDPLSDMYSLGCLIYAVHCKGNPPFKNHGSLGSLRENAGKPLTGTERLDPDLKGLLGMLITRHYGNRPSPSTMPSHAFFSSLPISTLNFLDRSNFASKSREEKISFMKGLTSVLDRFSEGLRIRKILPSLLEEMKDVQLLPYILPNVFAISHMLQPAQFASLVLPSLKPLFAIKEPPQNMITLLDNLQMLQNKTDKSVFREHVLPLVYNALESDHAIVQERALKAVPDLCESIDYAEVQGVLFPRVALVFTKTRILSVKVATLNTFLAMVKTLDQTSLTQKLVPLLSKIRTKEPAVMVATLAVQEAMGMKVDREAVATLVLPQLWAMSMGPLLSVSQFKRFMEVIKKLGDRVEKEHNQYLRDSQRIEDRSAVTTNGAHQAPSTTVDFESLVGGGAVIPTLKTESHIESQKTTTSWEDDVWGSIFTSQPETPALPTPSIYQSTHGILQQQQTTQSLPSSPHSNTSVLTPSTRPTPVTRSSGRGLGATPIPSTSFTTSAFQPPTPSRSSLTSHPPTLPITSSPLVPQVQPQYPGMQTTQSMGALNPPVQAPNYNISLSSTPMMPTTSAPPPFTQSVLTPMRPQTTWSTTPSAPKQLSKDDWGDFDPLA
ncbi:Catalytically Inactive Kinase-Related Protein [Abortiporus biennis]